MQIDKPNDGLLHGLGIVLLLTDIVGWGLLLRWGAGFTASYHSRFIGFRMYELCLAFPSLGVLFAIGCLVQVIRNGFDPITTTLAIGLFLTVCFDNIYLAAVIVVSL